MNGTQFVIEYAELRDGEPVVIRRPIADYPSWLAALCPPTYRREEAVKTLIALGWAWDGKDWIAPTPVEQCGKVDEAMVERMAAARWEVSRSTSWDKVQPEVRQDEIAQMRAALDVAWPQAALAQNAKGVMGDMVNLRDEAGALCNRMRDRIAELEAQNAQGEAVAWLQVSIRDQHNRGVSLYRLTDDDKIGPNGWREYPLYLHAERARVPEFDFAAHLQRQRDWSGETFGPGSRAQGVVDHIRKELLEIEADPGDLKEWIDVVILALDGAWRSGAAPHEIIAALVAKQTKNEGRVWPDWRTADPNKAIEHDRSHDLAAPSQPEDAEVSPIKEYAKANKDANDFVRSGATITKPEDAVRFPFGARSLTSHD